MDNGQSMIFHLQLYWCLGVEIRAISSVCINIGCTCAIIKTYCFNLWWIVFSVLATLLMWDVDFLFLDGFLLEAFLWLIYPIGKYSLINCNLLSSLVSSLLSLLALLAMSLMIFTFDVMYYEYLKYNPSESDRLF